MQINQFSMSTLLATLNKRKKHIICISILAATVGFFLGMCIPKEYRSESSIIPESNEENSLGGASALASMAGVNLNSGVDAIGPELYPDVVASNKFLVDMLYTPVQTADGKVKADLLTYLTKHTSQPWWSTGKAAFFKMLKSIIGSKKTKTAQAADYRIDPEHMSEEEAALVEGLKYAIGCQMNEKSGVIYVSYQCQDPMVAKTVVDTVTQRLQQFITQYRTSKARVDLKHYQELEEEAKAEYDRTLKAYADYCDSHKGNLLQVYESQRDALENEMQLALQAYTRMKQQVQMAEGKVQEKTPAFTVLEPASVPSRHAAPHKMMMAIMWGFLACVGSTGWYYVRLLLGKEK